MRDKLLSWFKENTFSAISAGLGVILLLSGLAQILSVGKPNEVLIIPAEDQAMVMILIVDVAGAVESPGVFQLDGGSRIADALMAAGGLAADADRDYVARFINQAEILADGMKIFVPSEGESTPADDSQSSDVVSGVRAININTASLAQLDSLWGIGPSRAQDIISNRPYSDLQELLSKADIPKNILENNQGKISVY